MIRQIIIFICFWIVTSVSAGTRTKPVSKIITQPNPQIQIKSYDAQYKEDGATEEGCIYHKIQYISNVNKKIVALEFGFVSYDIWNEYLGKIGGIVIENIKPRERYPIETSWAQDCQRDHAFHTGFVYVDKIRFEDGEIWISEKEVVLQELRKFDENFNVERLESNPINEISDFPIPSSE